MPCTIEGILIFKQEGVLSRALDVGCGPGGVTFELARGFSEVVGLDVSHLSITTCQELKLKGQKNYWLCTEGSLREEKIAIIDTSIVRVGVVCLSTVPLPCRNPPPSHHLNLKLTSQEFLAITSKCGKQFAS